MKIIKDVFMETISDLNSLDELVKSVKIDIEDLKKHQSNQEDYVSHVIYLMTDYTIQYLEKKFEIQ